MLQWPGRLFLGAAAVLLSLPGPAASQSRDDLASRVARLVDEARVEAGIPALAVAVVLNDEIVVEHASGLADREAERPATPETVFPAASVSKLLTAALVLQQAEKDRLDLDTEVNGWLEPRLRVRNDEGGDAPVTLRHLLSHASGLPVSWSGIHFDPTDPPLRTRDYLADRLTVIHPPGETVVYSNDGFALAGLLAARASGLEFEDLADRSLLEPLGMTSSSFRKTAALEERLAAAYGTMGGGDDRTAHADVSAIAPAGGLWTTARDLAQFARLILGNGQIDGQRLLAQVSVSEMTRLQSRVHPRLNEGFGLGFGVRQSPGRRMAWWDGGLPGAASRLVVLPEHGLGVVLLSNLAGNGPVNTLSRDIIEAVLGEESLPDAGLGVAAPDEVLGAYRPLDLMDPEVPFLHLLVNVVVDEGAEGLTMSLPVVDEEARLRPLADGRFRAEDGLFDGATVVFEDGHLYAHMLRARRVRPWETATAYMIYAAVLGLVVVSGPAIGIWRWLRRRRRRGEGG